MMTVMLLLDFSESHDLLMKAPFIIEPSGILKATPLFVLRTLYPRLCFKTQKRHGTCVKGS